MPKATIISEIGKGEYYIRKKYDLNRAIKRKELNLEKIVVLQESIDSLLDLLNTAEAYKNTKQNVLNNVISTELGNTPPGEEFNDVSKKNIEAATEEVLKAEAEIIGITEPLISDELIKASLEVDNKQIIEAVLKYGTPLVQSVWCADHTLKLKGEVNTIELSDETNKRNNQQTIIRPKGKGNDNLVIQPVISSGSAGIAFNLMALPAKQRHKPLYRNGVITLLDVPNNTVNLTFNETYEFSSVRGYQHDQAYSIFLDTALTEVPVDYMNCDIEAFKLKDKVVVEFAEVLVPDSDPEIKVFKGTVIGFVTNPYRCPPSIYLESGYLDLKSIGRCAETTYLPATLHFNTETAAYNGSLTRPMQLKTALIPSRLDEDTPYYGTPPVDGQKSLAVGCEVKDQLLVVEDPCKNVYESGGYCPGMLTLKQAQANVPASMFSGKLRLYIQTLYGSKSPPMAYRLAANFSLTLLNEELVTETNLPRTFDGGSFLFTTPDYQYFLCTYNPGVLKLTGITLSEIGTQFREELVRITELNSATQPPEDPTPPTDPLFIKRAEAYILSTASINTLDTLDIPIAGDTIAGVPLDYGWHSNWDGSESYVVCFRESLTENKFISNKYKLTITATLQEFSEGTPEDALPDYRFAAVVTTIISEAEWWTQGNSLQVFYYDDTENSMFPVFHGNGPGPSTGTFNAPVYCYYKHEDTTGTDTLITCDIAMSVAAGAFSETITRVFLEKIYNLDDIIRNSVKTGTNQGTAGFTVTPSVGSSPSTIHYLTGGSVFEQKYVGLSVVYDTNPVAPFHSDAFATKEAYANSLGYSIGDTKPGFWEGNPVTLTLLWQGQKVNVASFEQLSEAAKNLSGESFLQISVGSNDEVIIGEETTDVQGPGSLSTSNTIVLGWYFGGRLVWAYQKLSRVVSEEGGLVPSPYYAYFDLIISAVVTDSWTSIGPLNQFKLTRYAEASTLLASENELGNAKYFRPTGLTPATGTIDFSRKAINGDFKTEHTIASLTEEFLHHSAVGWQ